jgi:peptidoglycan/LPS O-acetylase OafA/YrhL
VDLFFVLSGFLITGILLDSRDKPNYFKNFYMRRFLRIMPLYFAVIVICALLYPADRRYLLLSAAFLANFYFPFGLDQPHGSGVFWSLAVEEHFYLVWPWLVKICSRRTITLIALAMVAGIPFVRLWAIHAGFNVDNEVYVYTWTRCDGLALGALLAIWVRSRWADRRNSLRLAAGFCCAAVLLTVAGIPYGILDRSNVFRYTQVQLVFAGVVVFALAMRGTPYTAPLRWRFARLSGDLSYCLYLVHVTVGDLYQEAVHRRGIDFGPYGDVVVRSIVMVTVSFALALLSRKYLEQPALRLKRYFEYGKRTPGDAPAAETAAIRRS